MNSLNLPELEDALEELNVFERVRIDAFVVELPIVLSAVRASAKPSVCWVGSASAALTSQSKTGSGSSASVSPRFSSTPS